MVPDQELEKYVRWRSMALGEVPEVTGDYDVFAVKPCGCCFVIAEAEWNGWCWVYKYEVTHWCFIRPAPTND